MGKLIHILSISDCHFINIISNFVRFGLVSKLDDCMSLRVTGEQWGSNIG